MIQDAIRYYHELLETKHLDSTGEILGSANEKLSVAGRPVCSVLRPCFIEEKTYSYVKNASTLVMNGIAVLCRKLLSDDELRKQMDLSPAEEAILHVPTGYGLPDVSARLDGFLAEDGSFHFVEYNADSPGGIGYGDALGELFFSMPILDEFSRRFPCTAVPVRSIAFQALVRAYHKWGGKGLPAIAIIDWKETATSPEFLLFQEFFERRGCSVRIGDPRDLEYKNGRLNLGDFAIDLVYKRLVVGEMLSRMGTENALVRAARDGAVCVANGFSVQMAFRKNLFALLSDPVHSNLFDDSLRRAIDQHIPWTRRVRECKTTVGDREIDLVPFIGSNRDHLVLKPGGDYGGRGVVLGWEVTEPEWSSALEHALSESYVVQERVPLARETYPAIRDGKLHFDERYFDLDPYVWNGERIEGCGVRLSRVALLNVSAGGGSATPMFILKNA